MRCSCDFWSFVSIFSQEGAFALAFKSTKFPGEIVACRFVQKFDVYFKIITIQIMF